MTPPFRDLSALLDHQFGELDLRSLEQVRRTWSAVAGSAIAAHTEIIALRGAVLIVYADSPVWANNVMHRIPALVAAFRQRGSTVNELRVRVRPKAASSPRPDTRNPTRISGSTAKLMREVADGLSDESVRASLLRLSRHGSEQ